MTIEGAVIREQGVTFAVVIVKEHVLNNSFEADRAIRCVPACSSPACPLVLMAQDHRGVPDLLRAPGHLAVHGLRAHEPGALEAVHRGLTTADVPRRRAGKLRGLTAPDRRRPLKWRDRGDAEDRCLREGGEDRLSPLRWAVAFPGCGRELVEPGNQDDDHAYIGEIAHIVADSRQGPRGDSPLTDEERDRHENLVLLCRVCHKVVDSQPLTYSVSVLRAIKADHEGRILRATAPEDPTPPLELKREVIHGTLLPLTHLPQAVFSAPCPFTDRQEDEVKRRIRYPDDRSVLVRFLIREGRLYSFHDLRDPRGPFSELIDLRAVGRAGPATSGRTPRAIAGS